jgi:hypothetical protein
MAKPYVASNMVENTIAAGNTWTRGTDTSIVLTDGTDFDSGGGYIRIGTSTSYALMEYTGKTSNTLTGLTACTLGNVVTSGDETKEWPAGTIVARQAVGEELADRDTLLSKTDFPSAYTDKAGYSPVVNADETALEFAMRVGSTCEDVTYYCDYEETENSSDDGNPGTYAAPFETLDGALAHIRATHPIITHTCKIRMMSMETISATPDFSGIFVLGDLIIEGHDGTHELYGPTPPGTTNHGWTARAASETTTLQGEADTVPANDVFNGGKVFVHLGTGAALHRDIDDCTTGCVLSLSSALATWDIPSATVQTTAAAVNGRIMSTL